MCNTDFYTFFWLFLLNYISSSHTYLYATQQESTLQSTFFIFLAKCKFRILWMLDIFCLIQIIIDILYLHSFLLCTATAAQQFPSGYLKVYLILQYKNLASVCVRRIGVMHQSSECFQHLSPQFNFSTHLILPLQGPAPIKFTIYCFFLTELTLLH